MRHSPSGMVTQMAATTRTSGEHDGATLVQTARAIDAGGDRRQRSRQLGVRVSVSFMRHLSPVGSRGREARSRCRQRRCRAPCRRARRPATSPSHASSRKPERRRRRRCSRRACRRGVRRSRMPGPLCAVIGLPLRRSSTSSSVTGQQGDARSSCGRPSLVILGVGEYCRMLDLCDVRGVKTITSVAGSRHQAPGCAESGPIDGSPARKRGTRKRPSERPGRRTRRWTASR